MIFNIHCVAKSAKFNQYTIAQRIVAQFDLRRRKMFFYKYKTEDKLQKLQNMCIFAGKNSILISYSDIWILSLTGNESLLTPISSFYFV